MALVKALGANVGLWRSSALVVVRLPTWLKVLLPQPNSSGGLQAPASSVAAARARRCVSNSSPPVRAYPFLRLALTWLRRSARSTTSLSPSGMRMGNTLLASPQPQLDSRGLLSSQRPARDRIGDEVLVEDLGDLALECSQGCLAVWPSSTRCGKVGTCGGGLRIWATAVTCRARLSCQVSGLNSRITSDPPRSSWTVWRREWDSNPRWVAPHTLSKRADSAALASLLDARTAGGRPGGRGYRVARPALACGGRVLCNCSP